MNVSATAVPAGTTINTLRFNNNSSDTITIGSSDTLTIGTGGILVTGTYANHAAKITGGTLVGGNPGSGSGNDLLLFDYADPGAGSNAKFTIDSVIADNTTNGNAAGAATALTKSGAGLVILTNTANTYTGNNYLNGGTLRISGEGASFGTLGAVPGSPVANNVTFSGGTLQLASSFNVASNRGFTLKDTGGTFDTNGFASTYGGIITGSGPFTKAGANTLRLTGVNTYTGATTVSAGTLSAMNTSGSATGTGNISVSAGATLAGTGTVTGLVTLAGGTAGTGGHIAPGDNGVGLLNVGSISLIAGTVSDFEFANTTSYDQLNVLNSGGLTINGGGLNLYTAGTLSPFSPNGDHTFNLFQYSGTLNNLSALSVLNPVTNFTYTFGTSGNFITLEIAGSGGVVVSTWNSDLDNQSWTTLNDWTAGVPHNAPDAASFAGVITADRSIAVDSPQTVGSLTFNNSLHSYTLTPGTAGTITMDNTGGIGSPVINVTGNHFITAPLTLNATTTITTNNLTDSLTLSDVHGAGGLTTAGTGTVVLTGTTDDYVGNTTIGANTTLQLGNATNPTTGSLGGTNLTDNGTLRISRSNAYAFGGNITGTGKIIQGGTGTTTLSGASNTYQGGTSITAGTLQMGNGTVLGSGAVTITSPGILNVNGTAANVPGVNGTGIVDNLAGGTSVVTLNTAIAASFTGVIQNTGGTVSIDKKGASTQTLNGVDTYTGNTTIDAGTLSINSDASLGNGGSLTINTGTLEINTGFSTARSIALGVRQAQSRLIRIKHLPTRMGLDFPEIASQNRVPAR